MKKIVLAALSVVALAGCETSGDPAPIPMSTAPSYSSDMSDLIGARGSSGESQLMSRGFTLANTRGLTAYWWNAGTGTCVETVTSQGRYQSVRTVSTASCGY
ncbi:MAG: lipoprotein [Hyphomicrobiaceae bacterium]|nr:lipoprotein [Hyphomicrobiaceae bacterium]